MLRQSTGGWIFPLATLSVLLAALLLIPPGGAAISLRSLATGDDAPGLAKVTTPGLTVPIYILQETPAAPMTMEASLSGSGGLLWGYEASETEGRLLAYGIGSPPAPMGDCVPFSSLNGRGVAFDPLDGNLWYSHVAFPGFDGDGFIRKTTPPNAGPCNFVTQIMFADGPGGLVQDDIGALEVDPKSKHLWAAGYKAVNVDGQFRSYFYLLNRNNGNIIRYCYMPFRFGGVGNDTLTIAQIDGLPGSGEYILTDAGEANTSPNSLAALDTADCRGGSEVTPVAEFPKSAGMTGIDFESPGLLASDDVNRRNHGGPPFATFTDYGPFGNSDKVEDISLCAFRAVLGGAVDCPY